MRVVADIVLVALAFVTVGMGVAAIGLAVEDFIYRRRNR